MTEKITTRDYPKVETRTRMDGFQMGVASRMAFPVSGTMHPAGGPGQPWQEGMTIRTWLAGQAIAGLAANKHLVESGDEASLRELAEMSVALADLIAASTEIEINGNVAGVL